MENKTFERLVPRNVLEYQETCGLINPIQVAEMLGHTLHEGQQELASYFLAENRSTWDIYVALCSRRWGKSFVADDVAIAELLTPNARVAIITMGLKRAKEHFKVILNGLNSIPALKGKVKGLKQEQTIEVEINGKISTLIISSETTYEARVVGTELTLLILDEFFLINPVVQQELLDAIIPTMATYGTYPNTIIKYGKIAVFSTPRLGKLQSPAGVLYAKAENKDPEFSSYVFSRYDVYSNPLVSKEIIESDRKKMSDSKFRREYLLEFDNGGTKVLSNFYEQKHIINVRNLEHLKNRDDLYLVIAYDYGQSDGNAGLFALYDERIKTYYFIDGTYAKNRLTRDLYSKGISIRDSLIKEFNISESNIVYFGDPSSPELIKLGFIDYGMPIMKAKNNRKEGFDCLNEHLEGTPEVISTIFVDHKLTEVIRQWDFAQFKDINGTITVNYDRDILETHFEFVDTARYIVYTFDKYIRKNTILVA